MPVILEAFLILLAILAAGWLFIVVFTVLSKSPKANKVATWMDLASPDNGAKKTENKVSE